MDNTLKIVSKYLEHNQISHKDLPQFIEEIHKKIKELETGVEKNKPSIPIEDTVTDDYIICLEDMKKVVLLKRHLNQNFNMSLEEYREKWGLPESYPVVPKNYANKRSRIAKKQGLGKKVASAA